MCSEDSQTDTNRLRLIERQKKILETRRLRQQPIAATRQSQSVKSATQLRPSRSSDRLLADSEDASDSARSMRDEGGLSNPSMLLNDEFGYTKTQSRTTSPLIVPTTVVKANSPSPREPYSGKLTPSGSTTPENLMSPIRQLDLSHSHKQETTEVESCGEEDDADADDSAELQSNQKVGLQQSKANEDGGGDNLNPLISVLDAKELLRFATKVIPPNQVFQCSIIRDKRGIDRSLYPTYYLHLQGMSTLHCIKRTKWLLHQLKDCHLSFLQR